MAADMYHFRPAPPRFPRPWQPYRRPLSERLRPTRSRSAWPPRGAASVDTSNAALAGRLSLSILSGHKIESIGTEKKIITINNGDST